MQAETVVEIEIETEVEIEVEAEKEGEEEAGGGEEKADILIKGTVGKFFSCKSVDLNMCFGLASSHATYALAHFLYVFMWAQAVGVTVAV